MLNQVSHAGFPERDRASAGIPEGGWLYVVGEMN